MIQRMNIQFKCDHHNGQRTNLPIFNQIHIVTMSVVYVTEHCVRFLSFTCNILSWFICQQKQIFDRSRAIVKITDPHFVLPLTDGQIGLQCIMGVEVSFLQKGTPQPYSVFYSFFVCLLKIAFLLHRQQGFIKHHLVSGELPL